METLRFWYREENPELKYVNLSIVTKTNSIVAVFNDFGYFFNTTTDGFDQVWYEFECIGHEELGSELEMFNKIAPYLDDDLYFHYYGDDGKHFKYYFKDGKCVEQTAKIIFDEI